MTPQGQAQTPAPQPGWFAQNWKWLVAVGCLVPVLCCGGLMVLGALVPDEVLQEAKARAGEPDDASPPLPAGKKGTGGRDDVARKDDAARVDCGTPGPDGVDCDVKRTGGSAAVQACWDLEITCANGGVMVGHACGSLGEGEAAAVVNLPVSAFSNQEGCDAPRSGAVKRLAVERE